MITPPKPDEEIVETHAYFYADAKNLDEIAKRITGLFKELATEGLLHNVVAESRCPRWLPMDTPIFENEAENPENISSDDRVRRLVELESIDNYQLFKNLRYRENEIYRAIMRRRGAYHHTVVEDKTSS